MNTIMERLVALRTEMARQQIDAWVIPSSDPHQSEYVADHWTGRAWASGFTGSAGTLIVLKDQAGLWTDGRYFIQGKQQLEGTGIELMREGNPGVPTMGEWLVEQLDAESTIGFDGQTMSVAAARRLEKSIEGASFQITCDKDLLAQAWTDRPAMPAEPVFSHAERYVGKTRDDKFAAVREAMAQKKVDHLLISTLDDIAWLFNLRGSDVACNPVFLAYALFSREKVSLYVNDSRIEADALAALTASGVELRAYDAIAEDLANLPADSQLQLPPATTSCWLKNAVPASVNIVEAASPSTLHKAIKNTKEIDFMRECHRRDGAAIVRLSRWLDEITPTGRVNEVELDNKLQAIRSEDPLYKGPSFPTIAGYAANGAICHYRAEEKTCLTIKPKGLLLVDSGGQYPDGTTDITRTFSCGELTDEEKRDYTLVLKSHINLATTRFKKGTYGIQLDMMARQPMWALGMDYNHGTGHGVGYFLNVHEGPHSIGAKWVDTPLEPGMLVTNEPGMYRDNKHGVRIENIMRVSEDITTEFGEFYKLEHLTLAPIDTRPLERSLLSEQELQWLNSYHQDVREALSPLLSGDDLAWLQKVTAAI
ncbi:aminopeptidase P family protein [Candidatus Sororendozoicomonas aggregata]|uniref:aminopeptidase P family protein n=1 Tax=Candidatus Sororendozoicomonas aggregata TaxID=3073239 RepID=UPI002ED138C6